jgi:hypothetical protein
MTRRSQKRRLKPYGTSTALENGDLRSEDLRSGALIFIENFRVCVTRHLQARFVAAANGNPGLIEFLNSEPFLA